MQPMLICCLVLSFNGSSVFNGLGTENWGVSRHKRLSRFNQ